ncbi:TOMM precursor leader peptide-binding protein [Bacillus mesophilum]|uniref:TOMM leader peptide-binding protein n=1 Tax=Bacillus mesophilum TaxID=1071718 RepID=A0A7V7UTR0_9BACI|nr:TOMM precursor leader peptide-binding protein [Bacillus mesophilum]KAB2330053.1 TOMM precursor leader peptide-binding protein [Bacillus mesophilum]
MQLFILDRESVLQNEFLYQYRMLNDLHVVKDVKDVNPNSILIGLYDFFDYDFEKEAVKYCQEHEISYLRANLLFETATIGPFYTENSSCIDCLYERLSVNQPEELMVLYRNYNYSADFLGEKHLIWRKEFITFVCQELISWLQIFLQNPKEIINKIVVINDDKKSIQEHQINKNEYCDSCFHLPDDSEELGAIHLKSRLKPSKDKYRLREDFDPKVFKKRMVDLKTGKTMHSYFEVESKYVPMVGTENYIEQGANEGAFGRTFDFQSSELSAYLEALERYSNVVNRKSFSRIYASYNEVKEYAINPHELTLHDDVLKNEYFRLHDYSEDLKFHWVWGYSFKKKKSVLMPEQMVFYKDELVRDKPKRFVYETSNGCALGSTIEEAVLYGLFEVIERDNFLVSWYNRLDLTEIDISGLDEDFQILHGLIEADGYRVRFYDTTMELGIPSVWAFMVNENEDAVVKTYSAAGCHFNPEKALMSAFIEVVSSVPVYNKVFGEEHLVERKNMIFSDGDKATEFQDHVLLYSHPKALERLDFLLNSTQKKTLNELYPEWYTTDHFKHADLTADLNELIDRLLEQYDDVYAVDISGDFIKSFDLRCVKVFVPGMLTMTFGHQYRRLNMERIIQGPIMAGRVHQPIDERDVNPFPHPFP